MIGWGVLGGGWLGGEFTITSHCETPRESSDFSLEHSRHLSVNDDLILCVLRSAGKRDIGSYSCVLENQLGAGKSSRSAYLDVHYPPKVFFCSLNPLRKGPYLLTLPYIACPTSPHINHPLGAGADEDGSKAACERGGQKQYSIIIIIIITILFK